MKNYGHGQRFKPEKAHADGKVDEALSDLDEYEKQEALKQESRKLTFPESCKVLWAFFIIFVLYRRWTLYCYNC